MQKKFFFVLLLFPLFVCTIFAEDYGKRVYLVSYPRAGNHWMRFLIEEATGMATGSVYCDPKEPGRDYERAHLLTPFPWGFCPDHGFTGTRRYPGKNDFIFLKTHYPVIVAQTLDNKPYIKAIRIIRHPIDSFYSHYMRNRPSGERVPMDTLRAFISEFCTFQSYWDAQPNVITIRYEDLYINPQAVFKKVLQQIDNSITDSAIERACETNPPRGGIMKYVQFFDRRDLTLIAHELRDFMAKYNYTIPRIKPVEESFAK